MSKDVLLKRRKYNQWVANETLEDYALRYTAKKSRRWSPGWVANTALGVISFLALEAIGGAITLDYGFINAMWAILVVGAIIFLSGLPLSYYAARDGVDIDLLTRGAGFGYIGSTISSLIYASFTFIFFALEAAIMSMALNMMFAIPLSIAYVISALVVIPLVTHGFKRISSFQAWTQPIWLVLQILPLIYIGLHETTAFEQWIHFNGVAEETKTSGQNTGFDLLLFGAATAVIFPLIAQNGEQADFLRFLPPTNSTNKAQWWMAVIGAGPGWVIFGVFKLFVGSFLAVLALNHGVVPELASDPAHMYAMAFQYLSSNPDLVVWLAGIFVVISQLKINVTNAYAGSIAWGNFFSRLTHSHPGRVVWLFFNVAIALMLMELGLYQAFESILITYACLVVAWIGSIVADLVINKPLGLSPAHIEFRRGHLFDINPVGTLSMLIASCVGIAANFGIFGDLAKALAAFLSLLIPFITAPLIAWYTRGRFYLCRPNQDKKQDKEQSTEQQSCGICENEFDSEDMLHCPCYTGNICSLCCALDSHCADQCRPHAHVTEQISVFLTKLLPHFINQRLHSVIGHFLGMFFATSVIIAGLFVVVFYAQQDKTMAELNMIGNTLWQVYFLLLLVTGILIWLYVLAQKSTRFAFRETLFQTELLTQEVKAHEVTAIELEKARDTAYIANRAKSRYLSGVSHELRTPLNTIFGYAQLMEANIELDEKNRKIAKVIKRSSEHLSDVIEGLLEISKIEARKIDLHRDKVDLTELIQQLEDMFRSQAEAKGIGFKVRYQTELPQLVSTDEKRLRQIMLNLLSNAIKFTPQGRVELQVSYRNQVARLSVIDTGVGIAEQDQQRIFEPFERVGNSKTQQIKGTGLGLTISRFMIEMMGGSLELTSEPNQGTEFCLKLFLPSLNEERVVSHHRADIVAYQGELQRIMIVDDEQSHRNLIADFLQPLGFRIYPAESAEMALAQLKDSKLAIDLFLLDLSMPGMNGWQLITELRQQGKLEPIIILSADPYSKNHSHQQLNEIVAYMNKPVRMDKLLEQLQNCLSLEWIYRDNQPESSDKINRTPDKDLLDALRKNAQIGYLQGILECLEQIEAEYPQALYLEQLKTLSERCDCAGIIQLIDKLENSAL